LKEVQEEIAMSDAPDRPPLTWTLGQIREMNLELECACAARGCGWFGRFDVEGLIARFGEDYWLPEGPGFPCEQCGGHLNFQLAYLHPAPEEPRKDGTQE